jgi:osmotically-inducible protein OsmY
MSADKTSADKTSTDKAIQQAVLAELHWEPSIMAGHIGVTVASGVVTLSGYVETFAEKRAAEAAVGRVKAVKAVVEEIEVRLAFATKRTDEEIAAAVLDRFAWDSSIPRDRVKAKVEKGWITLTGDVDWHFQSEAAEDTCRRLHGVVAVLNQIAIKPQVRATEIQEKIKIALHRSWYEPLRITVTAEGGMVHLGGSVRTWHERQQAEAAAWAAPGVTMVDDAIVIG